MRSGWSVGCAAGAASMRLGPGWSQVGGRGLRSCCSAAASMRLDHRWSGVAHTRPHRAGCPVAGPAVAVSIYVRPGRAAADCANPPASMPARFLLRTTTRSAASMPPTFNAGWERHALWAGDCCRRGVRGWGLLLSGGGARTRVGSSMGCGAAPRPCGWVLVDLRLGARLEMLLQRRRIHAARPSLVRRGSYAPASCGLPCGWSDGGRFYSCAARPGRSGLRKSAGIHAGSVLAAYHHTVGGIHAADLQCRMGTACFVGRRLLSSRSARLGLVVVGGGARTRVGSSMGCGAAPRPCGWVLVDLRLGARLEMLLQRRRIHAARPSLVRRGSYAPHRAGFPVAGPTVAVSIHVRPGRAAADAQIRRHPCRLGSYCVPPLGRRHPCRRPSAPDLNRLLWFLARDRRWCRAPAKAPAAPPSADEAPAAWMPPERSCLHETRACRTQADLQAPAGRRPARDKPYARGNFHRRARTKRADSGAPEQHGSSRRDAATPQQNLKPRPQPETTQNRAAGCGAGRATPRTPQACSRTPRQSQPCSRTPPTRAAFSRATVGR